MATRNPRIDPIEGDVLRWNKVKITVTSTEGGAVQYRVAGEGILRTGTKTLTEWRAVAAEAKVALRGLEPGACIVTEFAAGPCMGCHTPVGFAGQGRPHLVNGKMLCAACCPCARRAA